MKRRRRLGLLLVAVIGLVAAACGSDGDDVGSESPEDADDPIDEPEPAAEAASLPLEPGSAVLGAVSIGETTVDFVVFVPEGFVIGDEAPVLLALPPGGQDVDLAASIVRGTYLEEAARLGWVVVSPAAPNGELYFQGSEELIPAFLDYVETWVTPEAGMFHLSGISNGGISAFRVGGESPERFASLVAFPGYPSDERDLAALEDLTDTPVRMFVGARDAGWIPPMETAVDRLVDLEGDVELEIVADSGHIIGALSDGVIVFELLEQARP